jgi:hypothetical protein
VNFLSPDWQPVIILCIWLYSNQFVFLVKFKFLEMMKILDVVAPCCRVIYSQTFIDANHKLDCSSCTPHYFEK